MTRMYKREREDVFDDDGWYHTSDRGYFRDGYLFFTGRLTEMIKTHGANVSPREVELVLEAQPDIAQAFVMGVPDAERGEQVVAALVPFGPGELDVDDLRRRITAELSSYKVPRRFVVLSDEDVPWLASGKADRLAIREMLARASVRNERGRQRADLETALDELYAVDPADFMATRKQLVADLRAAGDAGAAKELGAARRPTNAAWALNQLARRHGDLVDQFLEQSRALREAQDQAVSGRPDELRSATRAQRDALAAVTQAANAVLGKGMTEAYRSQIAATLQAASVDDATAEVLRQGRVTREVSGATGFPDAGGFSLADVAETTAAKGTRSRLPRARESGDSKSARVR